jgi:hypothetical protein
LQQHRLRCWCCLPLVIVPGQLWGLDLGAACGAQGRCLYSLLEGHVKRCEGEMEDLV